MGAMQDRNGIWVVAVGDVEELPVELEAMIRHEGWRWDTFSDIDAFLSAPRHRQTMVLVVINTFTIASLNLIHNLVTILDLPVVAVSLEHHPTIVRASLDAGAEDLIALPTSTSELIARLRATVRLRFPGDDGERERSIYRLNETAREVSIVGEAPIHLSLAEYRLFKALLASANQPVSREYLRSLLTPFMRTSRSSALDVTMSRLRRKVGAARMVTIRGAGYRLIDRAEGAEQDVNTV
jgi:two-component system, OmpR family, response regulator